MMRTIFGPTVLAALLALATSSPVHAYGAYHRTETYTNPNTGRSATVNESTAVGPNGAYHGASVSGSGGNDAYHTSDVHAYSPTMYSGYSAAGVDHGYGAAVVRYP